MSAPISPSVRTRAAKVQGGYLVNGTKVWTSFAHNSHYMILFCRTGPPRAEQRTAMAG